MPYTLKEGQSPENLEVWYIANGKAEAKLSAEYENGYVTFVTGHFSDYAVVYVEPEEGGFPVMIIAIIAVIAVIAIAGIVVAKKRKA